MLILFVLIIIIRISGHVQEPVQKEEILAGGCNMMQLISNIYVEECNLVTVDQQSGLASCSCTVGAQYTQILDVACIATSGIPSGYRYDGITGVCVYSTQSIQLSDYIKSSISVQFISDNITSLINTLITSINNNIISRINIIATKMNAMIAVLSNNLVSILGITINSCTMAGNNGVPCPTTLSNMSTFALITAPILSDIVLITTNSVPIVAMPLVTNMTITCLRID